MEMMGLVRFGSPHYSTTGAKILRA